GLAAGNPSVGLAVVHDELDLAQRSVLVQVDELTVRCNVRGLVGPGDILPRRVGALAIAQGVGTVHPERGDGVALEVFRVYELTGGRGRLQLVNRAGLPAG